MEGRSAEALGFYQRALRAAPANPVTHMQIGMLRSGRGELEAAAAHYFMSSLIWPDNDKIHQHLGMVHAQRKRFDLALASYLEARRLNPENASLRARIESLRAAAPSAVAVGLEIEAQRYPSGGPSLISQVYLDAEGNRIRHGLETEWYEGGELMRLSDRVEGRPHGIDMTWDREGRPLRRRTFEDGIIVDEWSSDVSSELSGPADLRSGDQGLTGPS